MRKLDPGCVSRLEGCVCEREREREREEKARHRRARLKRTDLGYVVGFGGGGISIYICLRYINIHIVV